MQKLRGEGILTERLGQKVPEITVYFWVIKILTTGVGETTSDFFVHRYDPYLVVVISAGMLAICVLVQLALRRYVAWAYWLSISMVAVFGTMAAGIAHVYLGIPYLLSASMYALATLIVFFFWFISEKSLSVHSVNTRRREAFYWAAVLATFAMGTAVGDMTAVTFRLGFFASGLLFTLLIAIPGIARRFLSLNSLVAFWLAYVITRPLGASFADWLAVPGSQGGLNIGKGPVSIALWILIVGFVAYVGLTHKDAPPQSVS